MKNISAVMFLVALGFLKQQVWTYAPYVLDIGELDHRLKLDIRNLDNYNHSRKITKRGAPTAHCELRINEINCDSPNQQRKLFIELKRQCGVPGTVASRSRRLQKTDKFFLLVLRANPPAIVMHIDLTGQNLRPDGDEAYLVIGDDDVENVDLKFSHKNVLSIYKNSAGPQLPPGDDSPYAIVLLDSHKFVPDASQYKLVYQNGQYQPRLLTNAMMQKIVEIDNTRRTAGDGSFLQDMVVYGRKIHCSTCTYFDTLWKIETTRIRETMYLLREYDTHGSRDLSLNRCTSEMTSFFPSAFMLDLPSPGRTNPCKGKYFFVEQVIDKIAPAQNPSVDAVPHCSSNAPGVPSGRYTVIDESRLATLRNAITEPGRETTPPEPMDIESAAEVVAINIGDIENQGGTSKGVQFGDKGFDNSWIDLGKNAFPRQGDLLKQPEIQNWLRFNTKTKEGPFSVYCGGCTMFFDHKLGDVVKKGKIMTTEGYYNANPQKMAQKVRDHTKKDVHIAATNYMFRLAAAKTDEERQEVKRLAEAEYAEQLFATANMIRTVFTEVIAESPFMYHPAWVDLQKTNGVNLGTHHYSKTSAADMTASISKSMHHKLLRHLIRQNKPFTLIVDASTTSRNVPYLITYIQTLEDGMPITYYYAIIELKSGESAEQTFQSFWSQVEKDDVEVPGFKNYIQSKLTFLSSDSAAVMVGIRNSFFTRLRGITNSRRLKSIGCHAHKIALVLKAAIRDRNVPELEFVQHFEHNLNNLYGFYTSRGSKRFQHLVSTAEKHGINIVRLRKNIEVRWSTAEYGVIENILKDWEAIEKDLKAIPEQTHDFTRAAINQANGLHANITDKNNLLLYNEFLDFLGVTSVISRQFQERSSILADHATSLVTAINTFSALKQNPGANLTNFLSFCECRTQGRWKCDVGHCDLNHVHHCKDGDLRYKEVTLGTQDEDFNLATSRLIIYDKIIEAMHKYFSFDFLDDVLVFDNRQWKKEQDEQTFTRKVLAVCNDFPIDHTQCNQIARDLFKLVGELKHHDVYSLQIGTAAASRPSKFWPLVMQNFDNSLTITQLTKDFLEILLIHSDSSAEAERGFSFMNRIGKDSRSGIEAANLDAVLRIKLNGKKPVGQIQAFEYAREFIHRDKHIPVDAIAGGIQRQESYDDYQERVSRLF